MAGSRTDLMDIRPLLRHLQATTNVSAIKRATSLNRRTIYRYRAWAEEHHLLEQPLPLVEGLRQFVATTLEPLPPPQNVSTVEPYRELVEQMHAAGVDGAAILQRLHEQGYTRTRSSVYRFLQRVDPKTPEAVVRVEREPGTEGHVDFGYAGRMLDATTDTLRKTWAFVMTHSFSRHLYVELVFDQSLATWIALHRRAFAYFEGVPQRVVIDNLKAGIT